MAATLKKPSREKEEAGAGNMMLDVHPLHPSRPFPNRKPNRENRIKNACFSNSHSNIALSNDKRPLFVQIPATSSASLVSTSLPIQCIRPSNFFFFREIYPNGFLGRVFHHVRKHLGRSSESHHGLWQKRERAHRSERRVLSPSPSGKPELVRITSGRLGEPEWPWPFLRRRCCWRQCRRAPWPES